MFKKKGILIPTIGLAVVLIIFIIYLIYPCRTMHSVSRLISGLNITTDIKLEKIIDEWGWNGDGETFIKAHLTHNQLKILLKDTIDQGYRTLPIIEHNGLFIQKDILKIRKGIFKIHVDKSDPRDFELAAIDIDNMILYIYISYM
jgi:hypothetical protein